MNLKEFINEFLFVEHEGEVTLGDFSLVGPEVEERVDARIQSAIDAEILKIREEMLSGSWWGKTKAEMLEPMLEGAKSE